MKTLLDKLEIVLLLLSEFVLIISINFKNSVSKVKPVSVGREEKIKSKSKSKCVKN